LVDFGSRLGNVSVLFGLGVVSEGKKKGRARGPPFSLKEATQNFRDAFYNMVIGGAQDAVIRAPAA
jgi:hypothetical protein